MDTAKLRELAALEPADFAHHADAIRRNALEAADTIERLQKELMEAEEGHKALEGEIRHANQRFDLLKQERDAALADVKRWKREADVAQDNMNFITRQERDWR